MKRKKRKSAIKRTQQQLAISKPIDIVFDTKSSSCSTGLSPSYGSTTTGISPDEGPATALWPKQPNDFAFSQEADADDAIGGFSSGDEAYSELEYESDNSCDDDPLVPRMTAVLQRHGFETLQLRVVRRKTTRALKRRRTMCCRMENSWLDATRCCGPSGKLRSVSRTSVTMY